MTPIQPLVRRAAGLAAGLLAFGAAFELTARLEDLIRYGMPLASPYGSEIDLVTHDSLGVHGRPGAQYLKWQLNALGTRGPEVPALPGAGVLRVVATGASETFGQSEAPGLEYPRQLEDSLRAALAGDGSARYRSVEVLNAAFFGMSLPTATQDVRLRLARFEPAIVVLYPTSVQYLSDSRPKAEPPVTTPVPEPGLGATLRPRTLTRLREELKRVAPRGPATHARMLARWPFSGMAGRSWSLLLLAPRKSAGLRDGKCVRSSASGGRYASAQATGVGALRERLSETTYAAET